MFDEEAGPIRERIAWFLHAFDYNLQFRDTRFLRTVKKRGTHFLRFIDDRQDLQRRTDSTTGPNPNTWDGTRSNDTMFFRTAPKTRGT